MVKLRFLFILSFLASMSLQGQLYLENPSFEDEPQDATTPSGWLECNETTTPDILPGYWSVYQEAAEGRTFVGLISRSDGTYEAIGQHLSTPLRKNACYSFTVQLAHSFTYEGYDEPVKLRIWGGKKRCDRDQILFDSPLIDHRRWKLYGVEFTPIKDINYIIFEVFVNETYDFSKKGNILIDACSPIVDCPRS